MVEVTDLRMAYGSKEILKGLTFTIKEGTTIGLLGVNGAGKSTTMNLLTGYLTPTHGTIRIDGVDMTKNPKSAKKKIGYLPEIPPVYKDLKVREYLEFVAHLKGIKKEKTEVDRVLEQMDLQEKEYEFIKHLSKGYGQRIGFAQALLGDPAVLILDEPLVGLDPAEAKKIRQLIKSIQKDHAILISSHDLTEIDELCNEVLILKDGVFVMDNNSIRAKRRKGNNRYQFVVKGKRNKVQEALMQHTRLKDVVFVKEEEPGVYVYQAVARDSKDIRDSIFSYLVGKRFQVYGITRLESTLEDVFVEATSKEEK